MAIKDHRNSFEWSEYLSQNSNRLSSLKLFLQKEYVKWALILALLGVWGTITYTVLKDKNETKIEQDKDTSWYPFEYHHLPFWDDNPTYFTKNLQPKIETPALGVKIIRDAGLTFYIVQKEDIKEIKTTTYTYKTVKEKKGKKTISKKIKIPKVTVSHVGDFDKIRQKLSKIKEFSYLRDNEYDRSKTGNKTKSFNIPTENVKVWLYIPIPLNHKERKITPQDFANYCHIAIQEMEQENSIYSEPIKKLLTHTKQKDIISSMLAFARSETTEEYTSFIQPIGSVELHRREPAFNAFSFTYFHILMEKTADGKTAWPGLKARLNLWLTEWQCYHPKNAAKLFLAYWIEKTKWNIREVLPLTKDNIKKSWIVYNWSAAYIKKLDPNYIYTKKLINWEITYYDNNTLARAWFEYKWLNSKYQHVYVFKTPRWIRSNDELKKYITQHFNKNKADNCPNIGENNIVTQWGKQLPKKIIPDTTCVCISSQ